MSQLETDDKLAESMQREISVTGSGIYKKYANGKINKLHERKEKDMLTKKRLE